MKERRKRIPGMEFVGKRNDLGVSKYFEKGSGDGLLPSKFAKRIPGMEFVGKR